AGSSKAVVDPSPFINTSMMCSWSVVPTPEGMSAATSARNAGTAALPDTGPAQTVFADSLAFVIASVRDDVTGEPATENSAGTVSATEVTLPPTIGPTSELEV